MDSEAWLCLTLRRLLLSILLLALHKGVNGLKIINLVVPQYVNTGQSVTFECLYEMGGYDLYSVKWYKDDYEFYRYIPEDDPPKQTFVLPGVTVNKTSSTEKTVRLDDLNLNSSGKYKCEISAEAPSFETESAIQEMTVYDLPDGGPQIQGLRDQYKIGDTVTANCTASRSKPAAHLEWHINGEKVKHTMLRKYATIMESDELETSVLGLEFTIDSSHLVNGDLRLNCTAKIGYNYQETAYYHTYTNDNTAGPIPENKGHSQVRGANGSAALRMHSVVLSVVIATALLLR